MLTIEQVLLVKDDSCLHFSVCFLFCLLVLFSNVPPINMSSGAAWPTSG